ncbi:MAG TPA: hypothetical protein VK752_14645 [Bryobacteraceae bacterium]|nr:hypothetical protein [Bryobacteraceae bacterium]
MIPSLLNASWVEKIWAPVTLNGTALPISVPAAFPNLMVPAQDDAALEDAGAVFMTFTCAVSELESPVGGKE